MTQIVYELSFEGSASNAVRAAFSEFAITTGEHSTTLRGAVVDQAALHSVLARIQDLGLELLSLRREPETQMTFVPLSLPPDGMG